MSVSDHSRPTPQETVAIRAVMGKIISALEALGEDARPAALGRRFNCSRETMQKRMQGTRRLPQPFVAEAAAAARLRTVDLYRDLGWVPVEEVESDEAGVLAQKVDDLTTSMVRVSAHLSGMPPRRSAVEAAITAVLTDPEARGRFKTTLSIIESGAAYPTPTYTVAEFRLRDGMDPLPPQEARDRLSRQGARPEPEPDIPPAGTSRRDYEEFRSVRSELEALTAAARRTGDEATWQGDPGTRTWRAAADRWPAHLLVQSALTGASSRAPGKPWAPREPHPLVVIGSSYGAGPAAALLAEALGWQFMLVHNGMMVTSRGEVVGVERDWRSGRTLAWNETARHIMRRGPEDPWRAVILVRPQSFAGSDDTDERGALHALRATPARVLYARPPKAYLGWWATRQAGMTPPGGAFDQPAWLRSRGPLLERIEAALRDRPDKQRDLLLEIPEPHCPLEPHTPELPAEVMDNQLRIAWAALGWLNTEVNGAQPRLTDNLRPGVLNDYRVRLAGDETTIKRL